MNKLTFLLTFFALFFINISSWNATTTKESCPWVEVEWKYWNIVCLYVHQACMWWATIDTGHNSFVKYFDDQNQLTKKKEIYLSPETYFKQENNVSTPIYEAEKVYKENMSDIYSCAMNASIESAVWFEKVLLKNEKTPLVKRAIERWLDSFPNYDNNENCREFDQEKFNELQEIILNEAVYEICKYTSYLDVLNNVYLEDANILKNIKTSDAITKKDASYMKQEEVDQVQLSSIISIQKELQETIEKDMEKAFNVHKLSYTRFNDFLNNLILHMWLEWLRIRIDLFREYLYKVLWPMNQLPWKIINAMKNPS